MTLSNRVTRIDVEKGQIYSLQLDGEIAPILAEFDKEVGTQFRFTRQGTGLDIYIDTDKFEVMRSCDLAVRIPVRGQRGKPISSSPDLDPASMADPNELSITNAERQRRLAAAARLKRAMTLRHYVVHFDTDPTVGRGMVSLRRFISTHYPEAFAKGLTWKPNAATVLRAADSCGQPMNRPLGAFLETRGKHDKRARWAPEVLKFAEEMIAEFWATRQTRQLDAIAAFSKKMDDADAARAEDGHGPLKRPDDETLRLWIKAAETRDNYESKYGTFLADRRFRGRQRSIEASRPLEYIMIDHTKVDAWAVVLDEDGKPQLVERAWLTIAVDVYTRMVVGLVLTYEPPSVYSALECIRDVVRRKQYLINRFGKQPATDGWGRPFTVICDNGWEFTSLSFQVCLEAVGIDVIWAPIATPMFKAIVERMFGTLNENVWHRLPAGIPLNARDRAVLDIDDPKVKAVHTIESLKALLWTEIVENYHQNVHSGINMAPAQKWEHGIAAKGRQTVDDVTKLDKMLGRVRRVQLTAEGVLLGGQRFHNPLVTSGLLVRLAKMAKVKEQRKGRADTAVAWVMAIAHDLDASYIEIWDHDAKKSVRLDNWDAKFAAGLSWRLVKKIAAFAESRNLAFQTPSEKTAARDAYNKILRSNAIMQSLGDNRRSGAARELESESRLAGGNAFRDVDTDGVVIKSLPIALRDTDPLPGVGNARGGDQGPKTAKANKKKAAKHAELEAEIRAKSPDGNVLPGEEIEIEYPVDALETPEQFLDRIQRENAG